MPESSEARVAVYIDFDNIVISRYAQVHKGRTAGDRLNKMTEAIIAGDESLRKRLADATVNLDAILNFATSFGSITLSRAYADWSQSVNASYRQQLIDRAVDLVQLFPTSGQKNGADIRLAIDAVEDLFRLPDITHVVIVAGDSDYIALAQRARQHGRYVVGIGVAGSSSASLANACDEFESYDTLPGINDDLESLVTEEIEEPAVALVAKTPAVKAFKPTAKGPEEDEKAEPVMSQKRASTLLIQALRLGHARDEEWLRTPSVKNQMLRINPSFSEKSVGYSSFTNFIKSRGNIVELDDRAKIHLLRLRPEFEAKP